MNHQQVARKQRSNQNEQKYVTVLPLAASGALHAVVVWVEHELLSEELDEGDGTTTSSFHTDSETTTRLPVVSSGLKVGESAAKATESSMVRCSAQAVHLVPLSLSECVAQSQSEKKTAALQVCLSFTRSVSQHEDYTIEFDLMQLPANASALAQL